MKQTNKQIKYDLCGMEMSRAEEGRKKGGIGILNRVVRESFYGK